MTEVEIKELARKYINSCTKRAGFVILTEGIMNDFIDLFVAGFMKCLELKAGRPQWHDLRKDPCDLPEEGVEVLNDDGVKVVRINGHWRYVYGEEWEDDAYLDHWCEIPKYKENEDV